MKIVYFHRKRTVGVHSIENLFENIRRALPKSLALEVKELKFRSRGFLKRLYISVEAALNQGDINHITGDIHFIALFLLRKRTVLTIHDLGFMKHPNPFARFLLKWIWIILPIKKSAAVTVISEATKEELLNYVSKRTLGRIRVIYNPIGEHFLPHPKAFNSSEPTILQIGTKYNKNLIRLIHSLSGIKCRLEIVGELPGSILQELQSHKINYVNFCDLSNEQILNCYKMADIVSFVSTMEGFGLPIIEANAIGRVVITSNLSSMPEIAGNAAHLVDPYDVISIREGFLRVINDSSYRERLIMNGFENRKRFEVTSIAQQYSALYESLRPQI
jgi:glycosyltransferase involved in cell wall biosynthesis